jgi:glycosyltransferase involved in cell wall biosynthesis
MTRVLIVQGHAEIGGAEQGLLTLAPHLASAGFTPVVAIASEGPLVDALRQEGVEVVPLGVPPLRGQLWRVPRAVAAVEARAREVDAAIVLASGERMAIACGLAARRVGAAAVHWFHDAPLRGVGASLQEAALLALPRDAVVVATDWVRRGFRRIGIGASVIPYAVSGVAAADVRGPRGWGADTVVIAHAARFQPWKGTDVFIRAAARVAAAAPNARFLIIGAALFGWDHDYADSLEPLARSLGIEAVVDFAGYRSDAPALLAGSDVVVHASTRPEPFGIVVAEGMVAGRCVVASRSGGPPELIDDGVSGLLTPPGDHEALGNALLRVIHDESLRISLGEGALVAARKLTPAAMAASFAAVFRTAMTKAGVSGSDAAGA